MRPLSHTGSHNAAHDGPSDRGTKERAAMKSSSFSWRILAPTPLSVGKRADCGGIGTENDTVTLACAPPGALGVRVGKGKESQAATAGG